MPDDQFYILVEKDIKDSFSIAYQQNNLIDNQTVCRLKYHRILLIESGAGTLQIDGAQYPVSGSELFLLAKGQLYNVTSGTYFTGYELCFGDCFWEKTPASAHNCKAVLFNNAAANQYIPVGNSQLSELSLLFNTLYAEFEQEDYPNKPDALAAYLKIIMIKIANVNAALANGYDDYEKQLYRQFVELVSQQFQTTHEVAQFAKQLGTTARKLTDVCNNCGGKGAKEIINDQLIAEAKRSLQFSSQPVKEIAFQLNFSTPGQFSHFFKKNTQLSPDHYRSYFVQIGM